MPTLKSYRNGASIYMGGSGTHIRAIRGDVVGWTDATARRQLKWLYTVPAEELSGFGYAVTLTIRDLPPDALTFHRLRRAYLMRIQRMGATRVHWVIEWQGRGVPHLHAAIYFDRELSDTTTERAMLAVHWLAVAGEFGAGLQGQDFGEITGALGWLQYLAKHAGRGARHYQRSGHPEGWAKTGRMWGKWGEWPEVEPVEFPDLNNREFWRVRRIMSRWSMAQAGAAAAADPSPLNLRRVRAVRHARRIGDAKSSRYAGKSEWIGEAAMLRLVDYLERESA
jgi:hypothetical protein